VVDGDLNCFHSLDTQFPSPKKNYSTLSKPFCPVFLFTFSLSCVESLFASSKVLFVLHSCRDSLPLLYSSTGADFVQWTASAWSVLTRNFQPASNMFEHTYFHSTPVR
jgi:hypothetical protein